MYNLFISHQVMKLTNETQGHNPASTLDRTNADLKLTNVYDAGPTLNQHCFNVSCFLGFLYMVKDT